MELHPYFDKLNGHKSSKEVLTPEEYEQYMEALMSYQTVLVKNEIEWGITIEEVPEAYKERFIKAEQFMEYVNEKVQ